MTLSSSRLEILIVVRLNLYIESPARNTQIAYKWQTSIQTSPDSNQRSWGQHGAHLGPVGPRWAPCWPHEPCYQGVLAKIPDAIWCH